MGVLNVTPDSFYDGGAFLAPGAAFGRAAEMVREGADIIDVGGQSTRPGSEPVSAQEELDRVMPVIEAIRSRLETGVSVDTSKPEVAAEAIRAGVDMVNDVRALRDPGAMGCIAASEVRVCLMHMQGEPRTMQLAPRYGDVVQEVKDFLLERVRACEAAGIARERLLIDPGFGFGKSLAHNLRLMDELDVLVATGLPVLIGVSRKSLIRRVLDGERDERLYGGLALAVLAASKGAAVVRTHDVRPTVEALRMVHAVRCRDGWERE